MSRGENDMTDRMTLGTGHYVQCVCGATLLDLPGIKCKQCGTEYLGRAKVRTISEEDFRAKFAEPCAGSVLVAGPQVPGRCPSCGAFLAVSDDREYGKCFPCFLVEGRYKPK